jgi:hypothetical protein
MFAQISRETLDVSEELKAVYREEVEESPYTWRDIQMMAAYGTIALASFPLT